MDPSTTAVSTPSSTPSHGACFHLAIPVHDIELARDFYGTKLGFPKGRESKTWTDYDVFGVCQLVIHEVVEYQGSKQQSKVDGDPVPVPHFGASLSVSNFYALVHRCVTNQVKLETEPHVRFLDQPGEQKTFFLFDPSGNALEFKTMKHAHSLFARYDVDTFVAKE